MTENFIDFAGIRFRALKESDILSLSPGFRMISTINAEFIVEYHTDKNFKNIIDSSMSTFDGQPVYLLARIFSPRQSFDKISGSDLVYKIFEFSEKNCLRVFLLGGYPSSNKGSVEHIKQRYTFPVDGYSPPNMPYPFPVEHNETILRRISDFGPDIVLVGFGAKKQETWTYNNKDVLQASGVKMVVGVGGSFEFISGHFPRAPKWMQVLCLEGVYRLLVQPDKSRMKRLFKSLMFLKYIAKRHDSNNGME